MSNSVNDVLAQSAATAFGPRVKLQLLREEVYYVPRYKHWWQGWIQPRRIGLVDDDGEPAGHMWRWRGPRLRDVMVTETHWDSNGVDDWSWEERKFCGWDELLRPKNRRTRLLPTGEPEEVTPTVNGSSITFGEVKFKKPGPGIVAVRLISDSDEVLAEISISPIPVMRPDDDLMLSPRIDIS